MFFLGGIPRRFAPNTDAFPIVLRRFVQFCLAPLVTIYLVILYLYTAKILVSWELPNGWVALPVLILSVLGILSALLLSPLRNNPEFTWPETFTRWFYRLLVPLTLLLIISISVRIADYGVTENRYFVALLAGWLLVISIAYGFLKTRSPRWIPLSLGIICLISLWGPWSAFSVSLRSQKNLLLTEFAQLGVLTNNQLVPQNQTVSKERHSELVSRLQYLFEQHDTHLFDDMISVTPDWEQDISLGYSRHHAAGRAKALLRTLQIETDLDFYDTHSYTLKSHQPFTIKAGAVISLHDSRFRLRDNTSNLLTSGQLTLTFDDEHHTILKTDHDKITIRWDHFIANQLPQRAYAEFPRQQLTQSVEIGDYRVELTASEIFINTVNGRPEISSISLIAIVYPRTE